MSTVSERRERLNAFHHRLDVLYREILLAIDEHASIDQPVAELGLLCHNYLELRKQNHREQDDG